MRTKNLNEEVHCTCLARRKGFVKDAVGRRGWWVCSTCRKPSIFTLNECDICEKKHRDGIQGFPYATTCKSCESKL